MEQSPVEVSRVTAKRKLITFGTLVTKPDEYHEMVESAKAAGFDRDDIEYMYFDNSVSNQYDGFSAANKLIDIAAGEYLIFCHQDVLFEFDRFEDLMLRIQEIEELDPNWAILGNAGKKESGHAAIRITDPGANDLSLGDFPEKVMTVDENFIVINLRAKFGCTVGLRGYHLYGTDLCYNASQLGYNSYVIDFHLRHKSLGNPDHTYCKVERDLIRRYSSRKKAVVIQAMCSRFFISSSSILNKAFNRKSFLNLHKSIKKKI